MRPDRRHNGVSDLQRHAFPFQGLDQRLGNRLCEQPLFASGRAVQHRAIFSNDPGAEVGLRKNGEQFMQNSSGDQDELAARGNEMFERRHSLGLDGAIVSQSPVVIDGYGRKSHNRSPQNTQVIDVSL